MQFRVEIERLEKLRTRITGMHDRLSDLQPAFKRAAMVVLKAAKDRISSQGGGAWRPTLEQELGAPLHRTGRLFNSLELGGSGNEFDPIPGGYRVGTEVDYARYLQEGTGIYGPTGQPITPKTGEYLVFTANGRQYFLRSVRGAPPRPYLYVDDRVAGSVRAAFVRHIMGKGEAA